MTTSDSSTKLCTCLTAFNCGSASTFLHDSKSLQLAQRSLDFVKTDLQIRSYWWLRSKNLSSWAAVRTHRTWRFWPLEHMGKQKEAPTWPFSSVQLHVMIMCLHIAPRKWIKPDYGQAEPSFCLPLCSPSENLLCHMQMGQCSTQR